jgi:hypothetical protein
VNRLPSEYPPIPHVAFWTLPPVPDNHISDYDLSAKGPCPCQDCRLDTPWGLIREMAQQNEAPVIPHPIQAINELMKERMNVLRQQG